MLILSKKHTTPKERFRQKDIMSRKVEIYFVEINRVSFMFFCHSVPKIPMRQPFMFHSVILSEKQPRVSLLCSFCQKKQPLSVDSMAVAL